MTVQAAKDYILARRDRDAAKKALREYREKHGGCELDNNANGPWYGPPCYDTGGGGKDVEDWCETCLASQPLYLTRKKAGIKVGVTLRRLMRLCGEEAP